MERLVNLDELTERLTLSWTFQKVAFQISSEKQVCSANTPRSTVRPPSRQVNFVPSALRSLFHLLWEAGVDVCFCRASAGASTARILSLTYHFVYGFPFPICGSTLPQRKRNTKTTTQYTENFIFAPLHIQESLDRAG